MLHHRTKIFVLLFGTLLTLAACQKIDAEDIALADGNNKSATTNNKPTDSKKDGEADADEDNSTNLPLQELPDGTLFLQSDNHAVLYVSGEDESRITYVSLYEWNNVTSAANENNATMALEIAQRYIEGNVSGWRIPTREEARYICSIYNRAVNVNMVYDDALQTLNNKIETIGGQKLMSWYNKNSNPAYRYLCEDAIYSFSLKKGSNITKCGAVTKYNLRLIKDSIITR